MQFGPMALQERDSYRCRPAYDVCEPSHGKPVFPFRTANGYRRIDSM